VKEYDISIFVKMGVLIAEPQRLVAFFPIKKTPPKSFCCVFVENKKIVFKTKKGGNY